jgi:hypothetical protein
MVEMSDHEGEALHYLGFELDPESFITWAIVVGFSLAAYAGVRAALPQLKEAWESANTVPDNKDPKS